MGRCIIYGDDAFIFKQNSNKQNEACVAQG